MNTAYSLIVPVIMSIITDFVCSVCLYSCKYNQNTASNLAHQELWEAVHRSKTYVAVVKCPSCCLDLVQCCLCSYNIDEKNHQALKKNGGRKGTSYVGIHVRRQHKNTCARGPREHNNSSPTNDYSDNQSYWQCENTNESTSELAANIASLELVADHISCDGSVESDTANERLAYGDEFMDKVIALETERSIREEEEALHFVNQFGTDLDPESDLYTNNEAVLPGKFPEDNEFNRDEGDHSYDDFVFFDRRTLQEKQLGKSNLSLERLCPNQLYFYQKYKHKQKNPLDDTGGFAGLNHRAGVQNREDPSKLSSPLESEAMFRLLNILVNSTGKMKEELISYQETLFRLLEVEKSSSKCRTRFPTTMTEARSIILEGTHSIMKNFPIPKVFDIENHACVSLMEVVRLMAGHGAKFNFARDGKTGKRNRDGLNGTRAVDDLIAEVDAAMEEMGIDEESRNKTIVGWILMWSDGFLRCFVKQKENSVWIITVTVCPPGNKMSSGMYTYVLAMGVSSDDHTAVIDHYLEEIEMLKQGFMCYFGETNTIERVALSMVVWNADRPERQMILNSRKEGNYGKVSGWAVKIDENTLPACLSCYRRLIEQMTGVTEVNESNFHTCTCCCNWSLIDSESNLHINDPVGKDYPQQPVDDSSRVDIDPLLGANNLDSELEGREAGREKIGPKKLTNTWLLKAVRNGYTNLRMGKWTKANLYEHLRTCNIKTSRIDLIVKKVEEDKHNGVSDPSSIEHRPWKLISCFEHFKFPDVPLHAIGHGMIPDVMFIVQQIFLQHNKFTPFVRYANTILDDISTFRLDYCKVKSLPKAAWVGENCMAYMRLMSYIYGSFLMNHRLCEYEDENRKIVTNLKCMLNAFQALISVLMSVREVAPEDIDNHMKLFLSSVHYLHEKYGKLNRKSKEKEGSAGSSGRRKKNGQKTVSFVNTLSMIQLKAFLEEFGKECDGTKPELRRKVNNLKVVRLREKLVDLNLDTEGKKGDLQQRVIEGLFPVPENQANNRTASGAEEGEANAEADGDVEADGEQQQGEANVEGDQPKRERRCWNKGNWLSYMANISDQVEYLGKLQWIW